MDATYSDIQYKGTTNYRSAYTHVATGKNGVDKQLDREDALKEISKLPPEERKAALAEWKREYYK